MNNNPISFTPSSEVLTSIQSLTGQPLKLTGDILLAQATPSFSPCNAPCQVPESMEGAGAALPYVVAGVAVVGYALKKGGIFRKLDK